MPKAIRPFVSRRRLTTKTTLTPAQLERAARAASKAEGLHPDSITCAGRPQWQVYAELIERIYLPAICAGLSAPENSEGS